MENIVLDAIEAAGFGNTMPKFEALFTDQDPDTDAAEAAVLQIIRGEVKLGETDDDREALLDYGQACRLQGFRNGFKVAVRMMAECMME